jgi:hypothetical protein
MLFILVHDRNVRLIGEQEMVRSCFVFSEEIYFSLYAINLSDDIEKKKKLPYTCDQMLSFPHTASPLKP